MAPFRSDSSAPAAGGRRLRLAHVITGLELGGGGQVVLTIARALDRTRFDLDVFCVLEGGVLEAELRQLGSRVEVLSAWDYRRRVFTYSLTEILRLASRLRAGEYDVVHTHIFPADTAGRLAALKAGTPVIVKSLHNMGRWKTRRQVAVDRVLNRWTDKVICCSTYQQEVADAQEHFGEHAAVTINHGVDLRLFPASVDRHAARLALGLRPDYATVGTVGRSIKEKGHVHLLEAIPAILDRHPRTQFLIVGEGALRRELEHGISGTPYEDLVCFAGARPDIPAMLALMDVFVFPSLSEGFGIAAIEAMASKLPVVASRIRPLSEIVVDGSTGYLVPAGDAAAIAASVNRLLGDPVLRRNFGQNGRALVEQKYTDRHMVGAHENLYMDLYRAAAGRRGQAADISSLVVSR